jgi:hypothetical protein
MSSVVISGNTSGTITLDAPAVAGTTTLTLPAANGTVLTTATGQTLTSPVIAGTPTGVGVLTSGTAVASTSGTSIDFTSIPSWVKRVTVMFNEVSTNGTSVIQVQLGDSGGVENSGYLSTKIELSTGASNSAITSGHSVVSGAAANVASGILVFVLVSGNIWIGTSSVKQSTSFMSIGNSSKTLSETLDRVRITTVNGTDTFDAGSINILFE